MLSLVDIQGQSVLGEVVPLLCVFVCLFVPWSVPKSRVTIPLGFVRMVEIDIWGRKGQASLEVSVLVLLLVIRALFVSVCMHMCVSVCSFALFRLLC